MEAQMSRKIKAAVKAKLIDLEAYVDDELPDYIMVMVNNDKSQAQMASDLALFLGDDANKFASWLHRAVTKIKALTVERRKKTDKEIEPSKSGSKDATAASKSATSAAVSRESTPPAQQQKKIAISFKKKMDLKSKVGGSGTPLETSPAASPQRLELDAATVAAPTNVVAADVATPTNVAPTDVAPTDVAHTDVAPTDVAATSPVSSASFDQSPASRAPSPAYDEKSTSSRKNSSLNNNNNGNKKRKSDEEPGTETKKRKDKKEEKADRKEERKRKERQREVEEKEKHIVVIVEQIQRLKQRLMEEGEEEEAGSGTDDDDDEQQLGDMVRAKIASLRHRLESIQEELAEEEDGEEGEEEEEAVEGKAGEGKESKNSSVERGKRNGSDESLETHGGKTTEVDGDKTNAKYPSSSSSSSSSNGAKVAPVGNGLSRLSPDGETKGSSIVTADDNAMEDDNADSVEAAATAAPASATTTVVASAIAGLENINSDSNDFDSRCTTPLMDELPSPSGGAGGGGGGEEEEEEEEEEGSAFPDENGSINTGEEESINDRNEQGASAKDEDPISVHLGIIGDSHSASSFPVAQQQQQHLPAFLSDSRDWRICAECGDEKTDVVCLECGVVLHCRSGSNCFRSWHLAGKTAQDAPTNASFRTGQLPTSFH